MSEDEGLATDDSGGQNGSQGEEEDEELVSLWLGVAVHGTAASFLSALLAIPRLSSAGAQQLATDIGIFYSLTHSFTCKCASYVNFSMHCPQNL